MRAQRPFGQTKRFDLPGKFQAGFHFHDPPRLNFAMSPQVVLLDAGGSVIFLSGSPNL